MKTTFVRIEAERRRVARKFGVQEHADGLWALILGEEFGEACMASLHEDTDSLVAELIQVAAVATLWVEAIGRRCRQP